MLVKGSRRQHIKMISSKHFLQMSQEFMGYYEAQKTSGHIFIISSVYIEKSSVYLVKSHGKAYIFFLYAYLSYCYGNIPILNHPDQLNVSLSHQVLSL